MQLALADYGERRMIAKMTVQHLLSRTDNGGAYFRLISVGDSHINLLSGVKRVA